jgi:MFS family permease
MILSLLATSIITALYTIHSLVPAFILLEFLTGAMGVTLGPTSRAYISDESPEASMGLYVSIWWASFSLGRIFGPLIGTYIAQTWSFESSFYVSSVLSIALAAFILISFPKQRAPRQVSTPANVLSGVKTILSLRSLSFLFVATIFVFIGKALITSFLPLYAAEPIKMSTIQVGNLIAWLSGAQLLALPIVGWVSDRFGRKRTTFLGLLISTCLLLLYFVAGSASQLLLVTIAFGFGIASSSLILAMIPDVTPRAMHGTAIGIYGSMEDLGMIIGPLVYGFVWTAFAPVWIFGAASISQFAGALLIYRVKESNSTQS